MGRIFPEKLKHDAGKTAGKIALWVLAVFLLLVLIAELAIVGAVAWLHAEGGQNWLRQQLAAATADTGYQVSFASVSYDFPQGINLQDVTVSDKKGRVAGINTFTIRPDFFPLAARHLSLALDIGTLALYRLPEQAQAQEQPQAGNEQPGGFALPELYFSTISLDLGIEILTLEEQVLGFPLTLSPQVSARLASADDGLQLDLAAVIDQLDEQQITWLPEELAFNGELATQTLALAINNFSLSAPVYDVTGSGTADLQTGVLDIKAEGAAENLERLSPNLKGRIPFNGTIGGAIDNPGLDLALRPQLLILEQAGISAPTLNGTATDLFAAPAGTLAASFTYAQRPVELAADFTWRDAVLSLTGLTGTAPELSLSGALAVSAGTGLLEGTLDFKTGSLTAFEDLLVKGIGGSAQGILKFSSRQDEQLLTLDAALDNASYQGRRAAKLDMTAQIIGWDIVNPAQVAAQAQDLRLTDDMVFEALTLTATRQDGAYRLAAKGSGGAPLSFTLQGHALLSGLDESRLALSELDLTMRADGASLSLAGAMDDETVDLNLAADNFALALLPLAMPGNLKRLALSGSAKADGPVAAPVIDYHFTMSPLAISGLDLNIDGQGRYENNILSAGVSAEGTGIREFSGTASLPLEFSFMPFAFSLPETAPLSGSLVIAAQAGPLSAAFLPPGHILTGDININGRITGTLASPDLEGTASLGKGSYRYQQYDLTLYDLQAAARMQAGRLEISSFYAHDNEGGTLRGEGLISLASPENTDLALTVDNFRLLRSDRANGYISADLAFTGQPNGYLLAGTMDIGPLELLIPEHFQKDIPELNIVRIHDTPETDRVLNRVNLDIRAQAGGQIFVRGWGLNAEFGGALEISGTLDSPELNGMLQSERGRYEEFGRRFELEKAELIFRGLAPPSPYLDIAATTALDDITATVTLTGPLEDPSIGFSSIPALPDDEIMARILFGENLQNITPFQALQLKQTIDRLRGRGGQGFNPVARLRALTGFDDLRIDTGEGGETTVGVGKYLTDDIYLELEQGAGEASGGASLEIKLTPSITVDSKIGQDAGTGAGVSWSWDY